MTSILKQFKREIEEVIFSIKPLMNFEFSVVDENRTRIIRQRVSFLNKYVR